MSCSFGDMPGSDAPDGAAYRRKSGIDRRKSAMSMTHAIAMASSHDEPFMDEKDLYGSLATDDERREWQVVFESHDRRGEGEISVQELGVLLRALNYTFTNSELLQMAMMADIDGNGAVDIGEFTGLMLWRKRRLQLADVDLAKSDSRALRLLHRMRAGEASLSLEVREAADEGPPDGEELEQERWELLSVIDEMWVNKTAIKLDLSAAGNGLVDELILSDPT